MVEGPVTSRRFSRLAVRKAVIIAVSVLVVCLVVGGGWKLFSRLSAHAEKEDYEAKDVMARSIASHVEQNLAQTKNKLSELAKDTQTIQLFQLGAEQSALNAAAEEKQALFEQVLRLRYIKPGHYQVDDADTIPLSYASIDMLKKAETTGQINTEVHLYGAPNQHIVMIERVVNNAYELIGLLHLSLNVSLFDQLVKGLTLNDGYAELVQRAGGDALVLAKIGDASQKQGEATTVSVNDANWIVAYWQGNGPSVNIEQGSASSMMSIILLILALLVIGGSVYFVIKKKQSPKPANDKDDLTTYEGAVRAIAEGSHAGVEHMIPHLPKADRIAANLKPLSQGLNVDDATLIAVPSSEPKKIKSTETRAPDSEAKPKPKPEPKSEPALNKELNEKGKGQIAPVIFRAYDIRGVVGESLTESAVYEIAKAIGTMAHERGQQCLVVARDGRTSSPELSEALIKGLRESGRDVIDIGIVPTPVLYFATYHLKTGSGVMITGSHNAAEYNGLKTMLGGSTLSGDDIKDIQSRTLSGEYTTGQGDLKQADISADYIRRITEDIPVALGSSMKIVVDCGNGVAGVLAPQLLNAIGHDVVEMYCEIDGKFPNHHPDPSQPENLQDLIDRVKAEGADVGFAFDGDGDRLGVIDAEGNIIWPDRQLMLLAKDVLSRNQGANIIYDVKCSRYLKSIIETNGGKPLMWKTGHSFIKSKMKEMESPLAGEMSGHIFFKERWYGFDDALYTAARFIEIFTNSTQTPTELFAELPNGVSTPELRLPLAEDQHAGFMAKLIEKMSVPGVEVSNIDGLRIEYEDGWGLARPSNTSPNIILRFEGEDEQALERIKSEFRDVIQKIVPVDLPF
jgi:phosphomannomutase/phosphoglucomutase